MDIILKNAYELLKNKIKHVNNYKYIIKKNFFMKIKTNYKQI